MITTDGDRSDEPGAPVAELEHAYLDHGTNAADIPGEISTEDWSR